MKKIVLICAVLSLLTYSSCESEHGHEELESTLIVTSPLQKDTLTSKKYVCQIHAIQHIELRALDEGYLQDIYVDEGQHVKKGQLMFKLMPLLYEAELKKAQAEAEYAKIEYQNTKSLADKDIVSANELALTKAKLDKALAELNLAEVYMGFTEIKAPFDGIMDKFHARQGSLLEEGEILTILSDNSEMWVYFNVPEAEYLDFMTSSKKDSLIQVKLQMANHKFFPHIGHLQTIEADFNNETGNIAFRAVFPNPEGLLRHGETGNIFMDVPISDAIIIPQKATFEILEKKYVFVVDEDNIVHQTELDIIGEMPDLFIVNGLKATDKIVLDGIRKVSDGDEIKYDFVSPEEAISDLDVYVE
ncbi:efflux RND transporter periplasmic adaptor subunit [Parvicella tangerina]|uniref:Efflux pump periplasmic linker BepF n=1 Tax=Parvicella tangerina TaxID=2829795 RepID=A0A916JLB2_9FLAO|nr:efflux RND transporter periplasmic adaptor subunit [Parvicella tangerina]CAG5080565.1 Efflux pump periplasmic linker BepF [Parvicella tangerina]